MSEILDDDDLDTFIAALACHVTYVCPHRDRAVSKDEAERKLRGHIKALRDDLAAHPRIYSFMGDLASIEVETAPGVFVRFVPATDQADGATNGS